MQKIFVYAGPGSDYRAATHYFGTMFSTNSDVEVIAVGPEDLLPELSQSHTQAVVFPGSFEFSDKYLRPVLGMAEEISDYVSNGGRYVGLCAGAFLAFSSMKYPLQKANNNQPALRGIGLHDGLAMGPYLCSDHPNDLSVNCADVIFQCDEQMSGGVTWYMGGPFFPFHGISDLEVLVKMRSLEIPQHIEKKANYPVVITGRGPGEGRTLLSSVHIEYSPDLVKKKVRSIIQAQRLSNSDSDYSLELHNEYDRFQNQWSDVNTRISDQVHRFLTQK